MSGKLLKEKLKAGEKVYGTMLAISTSPSVVDSFPDEGMDYVIVTPEHTALDLAEFLPIRYALKEKGIACLARTHGRDLADVARVCDVFDGVVVPYVEDFEEAKRLAAAAVYRPLKGKVLERVLATGQWPSEATKQSIAEKNAGTVFIPMIESVPAIENLDGICSIPGVDAVFVGPGDLTTNMGIPKKYDHPDLIAALQKVIDIAEKNGVAAGCWFGEMDQVKRTMEQGARFIHYSNDGKILGDAMKSAFAEMNQA